MRVLILEDDPFIALDLQTIVEMDGHEVIGVFDNLAEAREHLTDGFDFALLDIDVADGKSFAIAAELKSRQIPFVFVSASRPAELPSELRGVSFVPKPYRETAILDALAGQPVARRRHQA